MPCPYRKRVGPKPRLGMLSLGSRGEWRAARNSLPPLEAGWTDWRCPKR
jgi:hypothetical protein